MEVQRARIVTESVKLLTVLLVLLEPRPIGLRAFLSLLCLREIQVFFCIFNTASPNLSTAYLSAASLVLLPKSFRVVSTLLGSSGFSCPIFIYVNLLRFTTFCHISKDCYGFIFEA